MKKFLPIFALILFAWFVSAYDCSTIDSRIAENERLRNNWSTTQTELANQCMFCHSEETITNHANNLKDLINEWMELSNEKAWCNNEQEKINKQEAQKKAQQEAQEKEEAENKYKESITYLWKSKTILLNWIIEVAKTKDEATLKKFKAVLDTFLTSKDDYTRNIWIYVSYKMWF